MHKREIGKKKRQKQIPRTTAGILPARWQTHVMAVCPKMHLECGDTQAYIGLQPNVVTKSHHEHKNIKYNETLLGHFPVW